MIEQYNNTFLETRQPNVIQTASYCCFEKFRIKRYPHRPSLDYPLDLTKSINHKIRKRKWTVTEVTRISVQPLYFRNHTPTVLYNQKYKEYEITKNVEISTK